MAGLVSMTGRSKLIDQLRRYEAAFGEESETAARFTQFVMENEDCFQRSLAEGHVTGSAWVVDKSHKKVLLTHHRKLDRWLQLGGHADGDSDVLRVAMREVGEESGLRRIQPLSEEIFDIDIHRIPRRGSEAEHFHYDIRFALCHYENEAYVVSEESHDLAWIDIANLAELTREESMLRMARKWIHGEFQIDEPADPR